jgi:hypothetical protein
MMSKTRKARKARHMRETETSRVRVNRQQRCDMIQGSLLEGLKRLNPLVKTYVDGRKPGMGHKSIANLARKISDVASKV